MTQHIDPQTGTTDRLKGLYKIGGIMALIIVLLIPVQMFIFIAWPPPDNVLDFFKLFHKNPLLGLLSLDLLYIVNNILLIFVYLGLYAALRRVNQASVLVAVILGLIGIAAYYASTVAFEMLALSKQYALAETTDLKFQCLTSGQLLLLTYKGTAFDVYYVLNAITLLILSRVMFLDNTFSKACAIWGLISGILMLIPTTAGTIGLVFGIASLIPWSVFSILIAKRLFQLHKE
ncbi:MAG: DUF4386 family protein [Bacteroidales bacterium]|jgi:hypothetical protein|nr:DUF4386 family protein [Bacteroidales bacterium]